MHPHHSQAKRTAVHKAHRLMRHDGGMTAGAASGEGRLQKVAFEREHPIQGEGENAHRKGDRHARQEV